MIYIRKTQWHWVLLLSILGALILSSYYKHNTILQQKDLYTTMEDFQDTWCVYWDEDIASTLANYKKQWDCVILFACYYDEKGEIYIPANLRNLKEEIKMNEVGKKYLSIVNDIQLEDGTSIQKDTELLTRLFYDEDKMHTHILRLLNLVEEWECDGIEIDYEKINTPELWQAYIHFIELLWKEASARNVNVRIVVGCDTPVELYSFPQGPDYIVMCYNLYGYHSGPWPKADRNFLSGIVQKFKKLPSVKYALANGGFDWDAEGNLHEALKESEILTLIEEYNPKITRDKKSAALTFHYQGEDGIHTVWYADHETLNEWQQEIKKGVEKSVSFCLWRLEGNE